MSPQLPSVDSHPRWMACVTNPDPLPPADPRGLPSRIVARVRRDVPLALLDALVVVPAYLIPLVLRFNGGVPVGQLAGLLGPPARRSC